MVPLKLLSCRSLEREKKELSIIDVHNIHFCFNTLKLRNYVCAIDDIIVKQVETKDINVNVNPSLCTCNMYFQQSVVEWEPSCLIRFSYKICKTAKLLISAGMGPVSPGFRVKLLQKIFMSHKFVKRSLEWFISKIWTSTAKRTQNVALLHNLREVPQRVLGDFLYPLFVFLCSQLLV
jgi:hypothetical protein